MESQLAPGSLLFGSIIMSAAGHFVVPAALDYLRSQIDPPTCISSDEEINEQWKQLTRLRDPAGKWIGHAERFVFLTAICVRQWEIAATWVAFKVAAKWEAWANITKLPDRFESREVDEFAIARSRRVWASSEYATLVVGTALNALIAAFGWAVALFLEA